MSSTSRSVLPTRGKPPLYELQRGMLVAGLQILGFKTTLEEKPFERPNTLLLANVLFFLYQKHFGEEAASKTFQGIWPPRDIGRVPGILPQNFAKIIVEWIQELNQAGYVPNQLSLACKSLLQRSQGPRLIELLCCIVYKTLESINREQFDDKETTSACSRILQQEKNVPADLQFVIISMAKSQIKNSKEEALQLEVQLAQQWNVVSEANKELQDLENKSVMELQESKRKTFEKGINTCVKLEEPQKLALQIASENRERRLERLHALWNALGEELSQQCKYEGLIKKCLSEDLFVNSLSGKKIQEQAGVEDIKEELNLNSVVDGATQSVKSFQHQIMKMKNQGAWQSLQVLLPGTEGGSFEYLQHVLNKHKLQLEELKKVKASLVNDIKELDQNNPILLQEVENTLQFATSTQVKRRSSFGSLENFTPASSRQRSPAMALMPPTPPILRLANPFAISNQTNSLNSKQKEKNKQAQQLFSTIYEDDGNNLKVGEINNENDGNLVEVESGKKLRTPLTPRSLAKHNEQVQLLQGQDSQKKSFGRQQILDFCENQDSLLKKDCLLENEEGLMSPEDLILKKMKGNMRYLSP